MKKNKFLVKGDDSFLSVSVTLRELKAFVVCKSVKTRASFADVPLRSSAPPLVVHDRFSPHDTPCMALHYVAYRFKSFYEK